MIQKTISQIEIPASAEHFEEARLFIHDRLEAEGISKEIAAKTTLLFEALLHNLQAQGVDPNAALRISCRNSFGNINMKIAFEGRPVYLFTETENEISPENQILQAYEDRIGYSYHSGYNTIRISVKRRLWRSLLLCAAGIALAFLAFLPIRLWMSEAGQDALLSGLIAPLEQIFGNAVLMIGAPVTFFSLLKNMTDTYILSERYSENRRLYAASVTTSVIIALLAMGMSFLLFSRLSFPVSAAEPVSALSAAQAFSRLLSEAVPSSIVEPFETLSPIPLILMALTVTIAFCSAGRYFESLKRVVDICYTVFSRMLSLVMFTIPFFCFTAVLDLLMTSDRKTILVLTEGVLLMLGSISVLAVFYLLRLWIGGVRLGPFLKKLPPLLMENFRINSAIDAVPYNVRYCARQYGMNRRRLERSLPLLARINLDGNCYLLMSIAMYYSFCMGTGVAWHRVALLAVLVVFLSIGAPNQPGSILIGTLILLQYIGIPDIAYRAIFMELIFGSFQNIINVTGDIVTVAIEEQKQKKRAPDDLPAAV